MVELVVALLLHSTPPAAPTPPKSPVVAQPQLPDAGVAVVAPEKAAPAPLVEAQPILPLDTQSPAPLTRKALCGELTRTNKELAAARAKLEADRKALENERKELEKLRAELATARAGLRAETDKLEALLARRGELTKSDGAAPQPPRNEPTASKPAPARPAEFDALARTLKSMKPEAAAAVIQRSEPALAAQLLKRMKPADAGAVMDRLKPELAAELVVLMSALPSTPTKPGGRL